MTDLIERLLAVEGGDEGTHWYRNPDGPEAAARIAEMEAEVARLLQAIKDAVEDHDWHTADPYDRGTCDLQGLRDIIAALAAPDTGGADG